MNFDAVIWDMDGLLLDTERLAHESWRQASKELDTGIDDRIFLEIIGMNVDSFHRWLEENLGHQTDVSALVQHANDIYQVKIAQGPPLKAGATDCIEWLRQRGIPQSVATSSAQSLAQRKLSHHDLLPHFHSIISGDQVTHGKPHPEIFQKAAKQMQTPPERCLVFEDSRLGVIGAAAARAKVVLVPDLAIHDDESKRLAFQIWQSLEVGPRRFADWFRTS
ncbi:MAG: HAD family phosphatase [Opitutales bacterium]|nr:HAD family phosphatase [Opitutales bacterium]MBT5168357.1 HAD family phosphatase [Opitutales bacterium]MBT6379915.1 HAD family phosphatase [Opitutales bacterium]